LFINEVKELKESFNEKRVGRIMDRVEKTGKLLNEYNHMKNIYSSDNFTMVFPNHKEEYAPIF
jgi:uncharacterized protein YaaR (DUF327 family)